MRKVGHWKTISGEEPQYGQEMRNLEDKRNASVLVLLKITGPFPYRTIGGTVTVQAAWVVWSVLHCLMVVTSATYLLVRTPTTTTEGNVSSMTDTLWFYAYTLGFLITIYTFLIGQLPEDDWGFGLHCLDERSRELLRDHLRPESLCVWGAAEHGFDRYSVRFPPNSYQGVERPGSGVVRRVLHDRVVHRRLPFDIAQLLLHPSHVGTQGHIPPGHRRTRCAESGQTKRKGIHSVHHVGNSK